MSVRRYTAAVCVLFLVAAIWSPASVRADDLARDIREADPRNEGVDFTIRTSWWDDDIGLDIDDVSFDKAMTDVQRVLFMALERVADRDYDRFLLLYEGDARFFLDGKTAREIGKEYSWQNPIALMRKFLPELQTTEGHKAYPRLNDSLLGGTMEAIENMKRFHRDWYLEAELAESP